MSSFKEKLRIKINFNKSSPHSSPKASPPKPPMLSTISESTSLNYRKSSQINKENKCKNKHNHNNNNNTPRSPSRKYYESSPCVGYETPVGQYHGNSVEEIGDPNSPQIHPNVQNQPSQHNTHAHHNKFCLMENKENQCPYDVKKVLRMKRYVNLSQIAKTLQGAIYRAKQCDNDRSRHNSENERETESKTDSNGKSVVIKVTDKRLHEKKVALVDGKEIPIQENIVDEIRILRWLTRHHPPPAMTRYIDCFEDEKNIFLIMEDGGMDFFKFVAECHKLINSGLLSINEWQCAVKVLFKQMIEFINWMHSKMAICHLDISLENLLITDVFVMSDHGANGKQQIYLSHNFQIKFCDFGLSTAFDGKDYRCNKFVGKTGYKAPKVYGKKKIFDARAADVWSLGIGAPPFKREPLIKKNEAVNVLKVHHGLIQQFPRYFNQPLSTTTSFKEQLMKFLNYHKAEYSVNP